MYEFMNIKYSYALRGKDYIIFYNENNIEVLSLLQISDFSDYENLEGVRDNTSSDEIEALKIELANTDYKAIKYMEGYITEEEYQPIKEYRQSIRDRINELEQSNI